MNAVNGLPALAGSNNDDTRVVHGVLLRCVDGIWNDRDGAPIPVGTKLLVMGTTDLLQRWQGQAVAEVIRERPLPDVYELNDSIPQSTWEIGLDGKPRAPWQHAYVVYLFDPETAERYTFTNSTTGARLAVEDLTEKTRWMHRMRGPNVTPVVELSFKT